MAYQNGTLTDEDWEKAQAMVMDRGILTDCQGMEPKQLALFLEYLSMLNKCVQYIKKVKANGY